MTSVATNPATSHDPSTELDQKTASPNAVKATQSVTITATVNVLAPAVGTPTGAVIFWDGATVLGTAPLNASRKATFTTSALAVGAHPLQEEGGDAA